MVGEEVFREDELLSLLVKGDETAFRRLYNQYNRPLYSFVVKYVHSSPLAEDLVQEVFIKIWENHKQLEHVRSFKAYLFTTARNHTLNSLKKAFRSETAASEIINTFCSLRNGTEDHLLDKEYLSFLNKILNSLPPRSREIFCLCREQKKTYEEVAQTMGISRNAVKNHMVFSMKVLRTSAEKELGISLSILFSLLYI